MQRVQPIIDTLHDELLDTLRRWIAIPSVKADATADAPFGAEVRRALDAALADCKRLGFTTRNIDNYAGDARMGEIGVDPLAILCHLDVVPQGTGWTYEPFGAQVEGGRVYGRGTSDDKGPAVAALFAMYAVLKAGIPLKREVRLILGCDEESGWEDIAYYTKHCDMPKTGFSPDASFPVINTEKGMLHLSLFGAASKDGLKVREINVGERTNVIPGVATALVEGDAALCEKVVKIATEKKLTVSASLRDGGVQLLSEGTPGHAAYPEGAKNALGQLLLMLDALGVTGSLKTMARCVGMEYDGLSLGIRCKDETSGSLTCNLGILRYNQNDGLYATLDIRCPILADQQALIATLSAALSDGVTVRVDGTKEPHHVPPQSKLVVDLLDAYHEETGRERLCVATGGGTYARSLEEGVAFGCSFPEDEDVAHQANEYIDIDKLMINVRIFARAIIKLAGA